MENISKHLSRKYFKEKYIKQINDAWEWEKKNGGKRWCLKRIRVLIQWRSKGEVGTLLLGNDKNNVLTGKFFGIIFGK